MNNKNMLKLFIGFISMLQVHFLEAQFLTVNGQKIVNSSNNQEVILDAVNFGNWMVMEGYIMNTQTEATAQHIWKQKLTTLIGAANTKTFYETWVRNHVTRADVKQVKTWGFNAVRLPLHYEYFVNLGTPDVWDPFGFQVLDSVVKWCKEENVYAIIDLHATPGGQSNNDISDYDNTKPSLWESQANKTKTVKLWRRLSERYKNEAWVAGYDLINEPAWNLPGGTDLRNIYGRITDTIRATGDNHILFVEGNWYANDYTGLTPAWDANMAYTFHKYWSSTTDGDIDWVTSLRTSENRPIWCGEHGENSNHHFTKMAELLHRNGIGTSWWPLKKFESINDLADAQFPAGYNDLKSYLGGTNPGLSPATAYATLLQLAENVKLANCTFQTEVIRAIITQPGNRNTEPFSTNNVPGLIYAPNYDQGMNGYAYSDKWYETTNLTTGTYTEWNTGWVYRNNGVDIERCWDGTTSLHNGYNVGWFEQNEWMQYTINVATTGTYTIGLRVASGASGTLQIQNEDGTQIIASATINNTGGYQNWVTVNCTGGFSTTGIQKIRVVNTSGGFNISSLNFTYVNSTIPATTPIAPCANSVSIMGSNGQYLRYNTTSPYKVSSSAATVGTNSTFTLLQVGYDTYALKGANGRYLTLNTTDNQLYFNATTIGANELFTIHYLSGKQIIQGSNNLFFSSENGAASGITCNRITPGGWEIFTMNIINCNTEVAVTGISTTPTSSTIDIGSTVQLITTISPSNATNPYVTYTSSNPSIATVNSYGLVTGVSGGIVTITATSFRGGFTSTSIITVSGPLPIHFISFDGIYSKDEGTVNLTWKAVSDLEVSKFEIHKTDNINEVYWYKVGEVIPSTELNTIASYTYKDQVGSNAKVLYYKIKAIDASGDYYSNIISVDVSGIKTSLTIFPNPFSEDFSILLNSIEESVKIQIVDLAGKVHYSGDIKSNIPLLISKELADGIYIVQLEGLTDSNGNTLNRLIQKVR